jgi:hypothetical protein
MLPRQTSPITPAQIKRSRDRKRRRETRQAHSKNQIKERIHRLMVRLEGLITAEVTHA